MKLLTRVFLLILQKAQFRFHFILWHFDFGLNCGMEFKEIHCFLGTRNENGNFTYSQADEK
jgi:hypothetical protein